MEEGNIQSANINTLWLGNIYENLKKIEEYERYAREGCSTILEYLQYPVNLRNKIIADVQYKNLRLIFNEMNLVIPDLAPVIGKEETRKIKADFDRLKPFINDRSLLITENYSEVTNTITNSRTTDKFDMVVEALSGLRLNIIIKIQHLLYIKPHEGKKW